MVQAALPGLHNGRAVSVRSVVMDHAISFIRRMIRIGRALRIKKKAERNAEDVRPLSSFLASAGMSG